MTPRVVLLIVGILLAAGGCGPRLVMTERPKGEIGLRQPESAPLGVVVDPATASSSKVNIDVTIRYASPEELGKFFERKEVFGNFSGKNPYPPHTLVFYVKLANHSGKKIRVNPGDFVLIDNLNIQYAELSPDDISSIYESKANLLNFAKTTGDLAPGPYGIPLKVAGVAGSGGGRKMHYLIKQVRLAAGVVFPGVAYDGYVAFPRPHPNASSIRLIIGSLKTDFDAADVPATSNDFEFPFHLTYASS